MQTLDSCDAAGNVTCMRIEVHGRQNMCQQTELQVKPEARTVMKKELVLVVYATVHRVHIAHRCYHNAVVRSTAVSTWFCVVLLPRLIVQPLHKAQ